MTDTSIINLSGYRFVHLADLPDIQERFKRSLGDIGIQGNIMLASEGINIGLAGTAEQVAATRAFLDEDPRFADLWFKESLSVDVPYRRLRVRVRTEIIAFDGKQSERLQAQRPRAPAIAPETLCQWLDESRNITLLDTRNDYEIESGTFTQAKHLDIKQFRKFKAAVRQAVDAGELDKNEPTVTFCTGGIRCEKAAPWLLEIGFREVYQIEGGLLNYLETCGSNHWDGDCFVFDERVELTPELKPTGAGLCYWCQLAVPAGTACRCQLGRH